MSCVFTKRHMKYRTHTYLFKCDECMGMNKRMKKKQTFIIEVVDTQDSTWQGKVNLVNGKKEQAFRSVMELLRLIDSVVGEEKEGYLGGKTFDGQ